MWLLWSLSTFCLRTPYGKSCFQNTYIQQQLAQGKVSVSLVQLLSRHERSVNYAIKLINPAYSLRAYVITSNSIPTVEPVYPHSHHLGQGLLTVKERWPADYTHAFFNRSTLFGTNSCIVDWFIGWPDYMHMHFSLVYCTVIGLCRLTWLMFLRH